MDTLAMTSALVHLMKGDVAGVCVCFIFHFCGTLFVCVSGLEDVTALDIALGDVMEQGNGIA